jgi:GNAT superfamily N-acetyltransferase
MMDSRNLVIEPLNTGHDLAGFRCGVDALDRYIQKQARQDVKRRIARVFVATRPDDPKNIIGYYTLSSLSVELHHLPDHHARKLPKHPIPAALIGRMAVHSTAQGQAVGKMLLVDAVKRTLAVGEQIAVYAMIVGAIDDNAKAFYEQFGFIRLGQEGRRLFLPLKSIER